MSRRPSLTSSWTGSLSCYNALRAHGPAGHTAVSSNELGAEVGIRPIQIPKDLSYFGSFGLPGRGYTVPQLTGELRDILGLDGRWRVMVVGAGRLGRALAGYPGFADEGFDIVALYDEDPAVVGTDVAGIPVRAWREVEDDLARQPIDIAIITVPAAAAPDVTKTLVRCGRWCDAASAASSTMRRPTSSCRKALYCAPPIRSSASRR